MGEVMRRYWLPIMPVEELGGADCDPQRTRLLGEDLVLWRDSKGDIGLIAESCPHRGASLFFSYLMIGIFVTDLIDTSQARVHTAAPENIAAVRSQPRALIGFSEPYSEAKTTLKRFLRKHLYRHPQVNAMTEHAQQIVSTLFEVFLDDYQRMPAEHANNAREHHDSEGLAGGARVVADYIAGMTDRFAKQAHENLHNATGSSKAGTS